PLDQKPHGLGVEIEVNAQRPLHSGAEGGGEPCDAHAASGFAADRYGRAFLATCPTLALVGPLRHSLRRWLLDRPIGPSLAWPLPPILWLLASPRVHRRAQPGSAPSRR